MSYEHLMLIVYASGVVYCIYGFFRYSRHASGDKFVDRDKRNIKGVAVYQYLLYENLSHNVNCCQEKKPFPTNSFKIFLRVTNWSRS